MEQFVPGVSPVSGTSLPWSAISVLGVWFTSSSAFPSVFGRFFFFFWCPASFGDVDARDSPGFCKDKVISSSTFFFFGAGITKGLDIDFFRIAPALLSPSSSESRVREESPSSSLARFLPTRCPFNRAVSREEPENEISGIEAPTPSLVNVKNISLNTNASTYLPRWLTHIIFELCL